MQKSTVEESEILSLKEGLIEYARNFDYACILDSHSDIFKNQASSSSRFDLVAGFGKTGSLENDQHISRAFIN